MEDSKFYTQLIAQEKVLLKELQKVNDKLIPIQALIKQYAPEGLTTEVVKSGTVRQYKKRDSQSVGDHVTEALQFLGQGTAHQVAETMRELYPEYSEDKAYSTAKFQLSRLNGKGQVEGSKIEGKNYFMYKYIDSAIAVNQ